MNRKTAGMWRSLTFAVLMAASAAALFPAGSALADNGMTLRVNDTRAEPGGLVAVVLRTYAPRGMAQGEICLTASSPTKSAAMGSAPLKALRTKAAQMPFASLLAVDVAGPLGDVKIQAAFDESRQMALVRFSSPSATVNESDGPLAVFYFRVASELTGPAMFEIGVDLGGTVLIGADGKTIEIEPRSGELEVRAAGSGLRLEAVGDRVRSGEVAGLAVETDEPLAIAGGEVTLAYAPAFAAGVAELVTDRLDGAIVYSVDTSTAGRISLTFDSVASPLNSKPGRLFFFHLPTPPGLADGAKSKLVIDPESTYLIDAQGRWIRLELVAGQLEIDN